MKAVFLRAHFDGEQIRLDEPFELKPDTPLTIIVGLKEDDLREDWDRLAASSLADAYGEDEPEYPLDLIKRPNPDYDGR